MLCSSGFIDTSKLNSHVSKNKKTNRLKAFLKKKSFLLL